MGITNYDLDHNPRLSWFKSADIRPYVFLRGENRVKSPGSSFNIDWFQREPLYLNALGRHEVWFSNRILHLEGRAFAKSAMEMPRWVFYDCALMPGFVAGFAHRTETLPKSIAQVYAGADPGEWTPLSLFIIIPTMGSGEWVAHNLCSVNSLIERSEKLYGLGFLTKAFGLWYANIKTCCGMTQWTSPAIRLHSHYGPFEVVTSFTPTHSYAHTLTYRCDVDPTCWAGFFDHESGNANPVPWYDSGEKVDPQAESSLIALQDKIESGEGPFYLSGSEIRSVPIGSPLSLFTSD